MTDSTQAQIQSDSNILVHITMKLSDGSAADSTKVNNKPAKIIMGDNSISPAFEADLIGNPHMVCSFCVSQSGQRRPEALKIHLFLVFFSERNQTSAKNNGLSCLGFPQTFNF